MNGTRLASLPAAVVHAGALTSCGLLLWAAGQPIFTDDVWWHLAHGQAFLESGPWLAEDPLLFAPAGPPSPASWLSDVALSGVAAAGGFTGLRVLHVAFVAGILALVWALVRHRRSPALASLGTSVFIALAAYRLVQLRPELVTIAATLLFYRFLIEDPRAPSWRCVALAAGGAAIWANAHAGFPLGLLLIGAAIGGLAVAAPFRDSAQRREDRERALRLGAALVLSLLATLANPAGIGAHLEYFAAGTETPPLERVLDEWNPVRLFAIPTPTLPPSLIAWMIVWGILLGLAFAIFRALGPARGERETRAPDPALIGVSIFTILALLGAARFLWLGIFPLLLLADMLGAGADGRRSWTAGWAGAVASILLVGGFVKLGDWPAITRGLPTFWAGYARPYPPGKYYAHAIWLLRDARLAGNLYLDYFLGGFAGYWLAPEVRTLWNGTLNVSNDTALAAAGIAARRGVRPGEDFTALLDRVGIDLFLGIRLPEVGNPFRPWASTTAHLEQTPGWIPLFRNLESAIYLRQIPRNRDNLARIASYYAAAHVPFDPERGFDIEDVVREAPDWAIAHGLIPRGFVRLTRAALARDAPARDRLAALYAVLGRYEKAVALDRTSLPAAPNAVRVRRRLVWALLRLGRFEEAARVAEKLAEQPAADGLSHRIARTAREIDALEPEPARAVLARLPFLTRSEVPWVLDGSAAPSPRPALESVPSRP